MPTEQIAFGHHVRSAGESESRRMAEEGSHIASVDAWFAVVGRRSSANDLAARFEEALDALWSRAHTTLGDVTLAAIIDRVLVNAIEPFPFLDCVRLEPTGPVCTDMTARFAAVSSDDRDAAVKLVLVDILTLVGNLTAEILTPALHGALATHARKHASRPKRSGGKSKHAGTKQRNSRSSKRKNDEEPK